MLCIHYNNTLNEGGCRVKAESRVSLAAAAQNMGLDVDELEENLITRIMMSKGRGGTIIK